MVRNAQHARLIRGLLQGQAVPRTVESAKLARFCLKENAVLNVKQEHLELTYASRARTARRQLGRHNVMNVMVTRQ